MAMKAVRRYSDRVLKLLWGRAAGRCAMPECRVELFAEATDYDPIVVIGEIAHVAGIGDDGPRNVPGMTAQEVNSYDNLILLCRNCHGRIDGQVRTNTREKLIDIKRAHEAWVRASLPERGRSSTGWIPLAIEGGFPLDLGTAEAAVSPDFLSAEPTKLLVPAETDDWRKVDAEISEAVKQTLSAGDDFDRRIAIYPIAPVSTCIALGYHFTSRPHLQLFQFHRDDRSWVWPKIAPPAQDLVVSGLDGGPSDAEEVCFLFHLTTPVTDDVVREIGIPLDARIDFRIPTPTSGWLQHRDQLKFLSQETRRAFESAMIKYPHARLWHIFFSGPAPGAIAVGQQLNPTMHPPTQLYEFRVKEAPRYRASIRLGNRW